ncbi:hypothetical protein FE257_007041 [Aspergillus nanangensis]|uniref:CRAL-TRIO domain-containing protein n=1 Tax=Aspergillus nanangensis TaxID=2582783 RepID=A0AAD4GUJ7_ASPNN|nr:hypothetical protein FE257_007041 [Aspergillus nanangensis]
MATTVELAATMDILHGLPPQHSAAFETFVKLCSDRGLLAQPTGLRENEVPDGLNDETALLRYLRARGFDPPSALKQFEAALTTHATNRISTVYNEIDTSEFESARLLYPHWSGRRTKTGHPICLFDIGHLNPSTLSDYEKSRSRTLTPDAPGVMTATQRASIAHDYLTRFVFPLCTAMRDRPDPEVPVTGAVYLVDLAAFTMKQGWDIKSYTSDIGELLMVGYPEVIQRLYVLNAPAYFAMMWGIMRKWLDRGTADKVVVLPAGEMLATLAMEIDKESIPKQFGGGLEWHKGSTPDIDAGIQAGLEWEGEKRELPTGPIKWVVESGRKTAVAVGKMDGVDRIARIAHVKDRDPEKMVEMDIVGV